MDAHLTNPDQKKRCPRCTRSFKRRSWPTCGKNRDGTTRLSPYCRRCKRQRDRERLNDPAKRQAKRESVARSHRKRIADPKQHERYLAQERERYRRRKNNPEWRERRNAYYREHRAELREDSGYCEHRLEVQRAWRERTKSDPEAHARLRRLDNEARRKRMQNPEKREQERKRRRVSYRSNRTAEREKRRMQYRLRREQRGIKLAPPPRGETFTDRERVPMLPVAPFLEWLEPQIQASNAADVCVTLDLDSSMPAKWRSGRSDLVSLDTVDKALTRAGEPWLLYELYPEMVVAA